MKKIIKKLPKNKSSILKEIPVKIMVKSIHIYSNALTKIINDCVKSGNFPRIILVPFLISQKYLKN